MTCRSGGQGEQQRETHSIDRGGVSTSSRRSILAAIGGVGLGTAVTGCLSAPSSSSGVVQVPPPDDTRWGETMAVGDGEVSTFVATDPDGGDTLAGVELTPAALAGAGTEHVKFVVDFPETGDVPFGWLGLDWEPGGHYPGDTYAIPHFDFHFYFAPHELVANIPTVALPPEEYDQLYTYPMPADQIPAAYFRTNYVFGYMGEHLYDETAPEYNGGTFGNTFVYGHWDGELIFMEPMITLPYFEQLRSTDEPDLAQLEGVEHRDHRELSMPDRFPTAGEHPTEYTVQYHANRDVFTVVQHGFERFEASVGLPPDADTSRPWTEEEPHVEVRGVDDGSHDGHGGHAGAHERADATVAVAPEGRLVFEPETLTPAPGDTVRFEWQADYHNVVPTDQPDGASWEGEPQISDAGHTHVHTFEVAGRYDYVCEPHESQGMVGAIVVEDG